MTRKRGPVPTDKVVECCMEGVRNASSLYTEWSGGDSLSDAPEIVMQCEIARCLAESFPYVTLEDTVDSIIEASGAQARGRKPRDSATGRVDIVVWWAKDEPRYAIEVKKAWNSKDLNSDAKRIKQLLGRGGSQQAGFVVAYTAARKTETVDRRFTQMARNTQASMVKRLGPQHYTEDGELAFWDAACFRVKG